MKRIFYCLTLALLFLACDSNDDHEVTDMGGLAVDLSWDEPGEENRDGIGLVVYDPNDVLMYQGYDSITIPSYWANGQFVCQVEIHSVVDKTNFKIEVQALNSVAVYTFKNSFNKSDPVGLKKTILTVVKDKTRFKFTAK